MRYAYEKLGKASFDTYGVVDGKPGKNFPFLKVSTETPLGYVGIEFEQAFSAHVGRMRRVMDYWEQTKLIKSRPTSIFLYQDVTMALLNKSCAIIPNTHRDSGGVEGVMAPSSLAAHQRLKEEYRIILDTYRELGYDAHLGQCGIHANIDYTLFGARTNEERDESIRLFLWFLYNCGDFMLDLSHRQGGHTVKADMLTMLGDTMGNLSEKAVLEAFLAMKNEVLEYLKDDGNRSWARYFNTSYGRDGRQAVELRWFGSTSDVDTLMMMIEFSFAIAEFIRTCRKEELMSLETFCDFCKVHMVEYPHLIEELFNNEYSSVHMRSNFAPEQVEVPTSRRVAIY